MPHQSQKRCPSQRLTIFYRYSPTLAQQVGHQLIHLLQAWRRLFPVNCQSSIKTYFQWGRSTYLAVIFHGLRYVVQTECISEGRKRQDSAYVSCVKSIEGSSPGNGNEQVEKAKIENLPRISLRLAAKPDACSSRHCSFGGYSQ